ncbi:MAG: hypothetical protein DWQ47_03350 [Acidobacteria bacterium]|nr:MAG: hypothetical protein DWQ32_06900 [Acidobacteriota bacterium]REK01439.1 MAG: hypothetical protein DWQ38_03335 [Acidobacteriota bacterium]REK14395.1 MAG: hypothetical protein DWQ43_12590 [Acidobacteriota bacterium]REK45110.1 MAG: hypothetical protein DWQ47_03350 [Acidobacteriota bacterium]
MDSSFFNVLGKSFGLKLPESAPDAWIRRWLPQNSVFSEEAVNCIGTFELRVEESELENGLYWQDELLCSFGGYDEETADGFEALVQMTLASNSLPEHLFLHAGAVDLDGIGIIFPGDSRSGKSTLTRCFLEKGAKYYSDDCAVVDSSGRLVPFPSALKQREGRKNRRVEDLSFETAGTGTNKSIDLVLFSDFESGASWAPEKLSDSEAVWRLLQNLFFPPAMRENPKEALGILRSVCGGAECYLGKRGEASEIVQFVRGLS